MKNQFQNRRFAPRVLIADDIMENARLIALRLEKMGCLCTIVSRGDKALEAHFKGQPFDLILMDLRMPEIDGIEATRLLRKKESGKKTPVVGITALSGPRETKACLEAGMARVIEKPVDFSLLAAFIQELFPVQGQPPARQDPDPAVQNLQTIEGFSAEKALERSQDPQALTDALRRFSLKLMGSIKPLEKAALCRDKTIFHEKIHALTGACENLSLFQIASILKALKKEDGAPAALFKELFKRASALHAQLPKKRCKAPPTTSLLPFTPWLEKAFDALAQDNPDAMAPLLAQAPISALQKKTVKELIDTFDFKEAD